MERDVRSFSAKGSGKGKPRQDILEVEMERSGAPPLALPPLLYPLYSSCFPGLINQI